MAICNSRANVGIFSTVRHDYARETASANVLLLLAITICRYFSIYYLVNLMIRLHVC